MNRLRAALEYRKEVMPVGLVNLLAKRATSDGELDSIILSTLQIIEPPFCQKSHCPSHTTYAFCGCSEKLVPGKCPLNLKYLKDRRQREAKIKEDIINEMLTIYKVSPETAEHSFQNVLRSSGSINRAKDWWAKNKPNVKRFLKKNKQ